jgi:hypothetical protein
MPSETERRSPRVSLAAGNGAEAFAPLRGTFLQRSAPATLRVGADRVARVCGSISRRPRTSYGTKVGACGNREDKKGFAICFIESLCCWRR